MMALEEVREYALSLPCVTEDMPFGEDHLVFRIGGKIFMIMSLDGNNYICVKCNPDRAVDLREMYRDIEPAFHMNKKHWNGIYCGGHLHRNIIEEQIRHSYDLIYSKLPLSVRQSIQP